MIVQLDKNSLFSIFAVESFELLENSLSSLAPSMVEYYLSDLGSSSMDNIYLNKRNIQQSINVGEYSLYLDYNSDIFLEINVNENCEYETGSLW